jgi:hypothetical protein
VYQGLHVEEEKRPYSILRLSFHFFCPDSTSTYPLLSVLPGTQATVSSAPLDGRWYLSVPAAWGRAFVLSIATAAISSHSTPSSERDQFSGSPEIQSRNAFALTIASHQPNVHNVRPGAPRPTCHDEWRSGPPAVWHANPQVSVTKPPSAPHPTASPPRPPHTNCA